MEKLKEQKENDEKITRLREFKANIEVDIIKLEKILHLDTADTEASAQVKKELQQTLKETETKYEKVQKKISEENNILAQNRIKKQELRQKINELRNPSLIEELNAFEEKRKEIQETLLQKVSDIKNTNAQIENILSPELNSITKKKNA